MNIKTWHEGMTDAESKDLAYWERNMLALHYADGWYRDRIPVAEHRQQELEQYVPGLSGQVTKPRYAGWERVLSLEGGKTTFHIPDDFDVGDLPELWPNWDGHTTEQKWQRIAAARGIK